MYHEDHKQQYPGLQLEYDQKQFSRNYCIECDQFCKKPHCYDPGCRTDPHHTIFKTCDYESWCNECKKCHSKTLFFCKDCNDCYMKAHCHAINCKSDPHHTHGYKAKSKDEMCIQCNQCHELTLYSHLTNIQIITDIDNMTIKNMFPIPIIDIIAEYFMETWQLQISFAKYCAKCNECFFRLRSINHCPAIECQSDPHHKRESKANSLICKICDKCHQKTFITFCSICNECFHPDNSNHCFSKECESDQHHISSMRCAEKHQNVLWQMRLKRLLKQRLIK